MVVAIDDSFGQRLALGWLIAANRGVRRLGLTHGRLFRRPVRGTVMQFAGSRVRRYAVGTLGILAVLVFLVAFFPWNWLRGPIASIATVGLPSAARARVPRRNAARSDGTVMEARV